MIQFKVSAPGKVILFGEHSVVYKKTAVAAGIDLRTRLTFKELPNDNVVCMKMNELSMISSVAIEKIEKFFFQGTKPQYETYEDYFLQSVIEFVNELKPENRARTLSLQAAFYLLIAVFQSKGLRKIKPFQIEIDTDLSIGSGLGSSASFAVCLATCYLHYSNILLDKKTELSYDFLKEISQFAYNCEKIMHGTPSGIDNTICTHGSLLYFKKDEFSIQFSCQTTMKIMLVDTKVQRNTKTLVQKVRDSKDKYPDIFNPILEAMDYVAKEGMRTVKCITQPGNNQNWDEEYTKLTKLTEINHGLLFALGVSHPTLDIICLEAKNCGFGAKLTGAGGGGYAYVIIPHNTPENKVNDLSSKLTNREFVVQLTTIGGCGVTID